MSSASHLPRGSAGTPRPTGAYTKTGRYTIVSMALLASGFAGLFYSLKARDEKRRHEGKLHQYEHAIESRPGGALIIGSDTSSLSSIPSSGAPKPPTQTHNAQHHTRTPGWTQDTEGVHAHHATGGHIHQPAPQRERGDGSGVAYTKKVV